MDYMEQKHETDKQPDALRWIEVGSNGNEVVKQAMWSFWNFAHIFDDLVDRTSFSLNEKEMMYEGLYKFIVDLLVNPFYIAHNLEMKAMFTSAIMRQIAAEYEQDSTIRDVVKCADIDVIVHMIALHRGFEEANKLSKIRVYDIEKET